MKGGGPMSEFEHAGEFKDHKCDPVTGGKVRDYLSSVPRDYPAGKSSPAGREGLARDHLTFRIGGSVRSKPPVGTIALRIVLGLLALAAMIVALRHFLS
jgi:hypothetical protein